MLFTLGIKCPHYGYGGISFHNSSSLLHIPKPHGIRVY
jgi:hypothetical protein